MNEPHEHTGPEVEGLDRFLGKQLDVVWAQRGSLLRRIGNGSPRRAQDKAGQRFFASGEIGAAVEV